MNKLILKYTLIIQVVTDEGTFLVQEIIAKLHKKKITVCIVGVGYVGYPLACAFSKHIDVIGYDINASKIEHYNSLNKNDSLFFTDDESLIKKADITIICVPTPINKSKDPNFDPIISSSITVGKNMRSESVVVVESTFYPGVTEDIIVPILEEESGLTCGESFWVGYSPERVNPGDDENTLTSITKIVSGMDAVTTRLLNDLYSLITTTYPVENIKTAEAAKVIENIQRDLNIALVNELSIIMKKLDIDIDEVLDAAATKWNFHRYSPGFVGGHCIPVDPYYLVHRAKELHYHPEVILAGRAINDSMPKYVADMAIKGMIESNKLINQSKILVMGLTYKENVPDTRESPSLKLISELSEYGCVVYAIDPYLSIEELSVFGAIPYVVGHPVDCAIIAVKHTEFLNYTMEDFNKMMPSNPILVDVKGIFKNNSEITEFVLYLKL
jgi:UDP-N-acetyl-D-glucosamine/UDP-N-acetyl-D-galactosamine dehydrogenase